MRLGLVQHLGWAVAVTASAGHQVVDRRRIELLEPGMPVAPIEHDCRPLDDAAAARLVASVRASAVRAASESLTQLAAALAEPIVSMSLRSWPLDFPDDIAVQHRAPYASRADSVMYRQVLADLAHARGWAVHFYDVRDVESQARPTSLATGPTRYSTARGSRSGRPGPRTTGPPSRPRSWPARTEHDSLFPEFSG